MMKRSMMDTLCAFGSSDWLAATPSMSMLETGPSESERTLNLHEAGACRKATWPNSVAAPIERTAKPGILRIFSGGHPCRRRRKRLLCRSQPDEPGSREKGGAGSPSLGSKGRPCSRSGASRGRGGGRGANVLFLSERCISGTAGPYDLARPCHLWIDYGAESLRFEMR